MPKNLPPRPLQRRLLTLALGVLAALSLASTAGAHHLEASVSVPIRALAGFGAKPDLYPLLPTTAASYSGTVPAVFVDAFEVDGRLVYRFDAVIANAGGTLDLYSTDGGATLNQVLWPGGRPPAGDQPTPVAPPGTQNLANALQGNRFVYSSAVGHWHWHYDLAARYELLLPKGKKRVTGKIGFCMFDTYDFANNETYFRGSGTQTNDWCRPKLPSAKFVRMGISPGVGDYYAAQLADQWIDVTGLKPGSYVLRAVVNPGGRLIESDATNNALESARLIPGPTAKNVAKSVPRNSSAGIPLTGDLLAPEIHAFSGWKNAANGEKCQLRFGECYVTAEPDVLSFRIVRPPDHGTVSIASPNGLSATATYVADPGYEGADSFSYVTTDTRRLTSAPATVTIGVGDVPVVIAAPVVTGTPALGAGLTALPGSWLAPDGVAVEFRYRWQRCGGKGDNCTNVPGAKRSTYRITRADVGRHIRVVVTAATTFASGSANSRRSRRVARLATLRGTQFDDILLGKKLSEKIEGGRGADLIRGRGGNDVIMGGPGADRIFGGPGVDKLRGGAGNDQLFSKDGRIDVVTCGSGFDVVVADVKDVIARSCEKVSRR
jgi:hypothetical protein